MASKLKLLRQAFRHKGFVSKIPTLFVMVKAIIKKEYKPGYKNVIVPALVLAYIISPIDIIPDWIPLIGALDDLALIALAMPMLMKELEAFEAWQEQKKNIKTIDAEPV
ncbi:DUF1232 domain-containing protein [Riemerella columbina]|uniref:DUF1232 domain-containing protein n=1 Tax=Riemerella columbina TaxID=103810 RepID=UPI00036B2681|nr:DUF1232 domain-containing protein [Riemerella columbina]